MQRHHIDILLCYRGRYRKQIEILDKLLESQDLNVTFDREILTKDVEYYESEIEWMSLSD